MVVDVWTPTSAMINDTPLILALLTSLNYTVFFLLTEIEKGYFDKSRNKSNKKIMLMNS